MSGRATRIRNSAKAIIIEKGKILVMRARDTEGDWYLLPGGGQEPTESLEDTLNRECIEEVNVHIEIGPLRFIREYFSSNHEFAAIDHDAHQIEFMFVCKLREGEVPSIGSVPDKDQSGIEWIELKQLEKYRLYPLTMRKHFMDIENKLIAVYLGDIN